MTVERASGARAGFHLLNNIQGESIIQVGFALLEPFWGRGYGTEMAAAVLRYGFAELGLPTIAGMASLQNLASQRVLAKIGLERRGERAFAASSLRRRRPDGVVRTRTRRLAGAVLTLVRSCSTASRA